MSLGMFKLLVSALVMALCVIIGFMGKDDLAVLVGAAAGLGLGVIIHAEKVKGKE